MNLDRTMPRSCNTSSTIRSSWGPTREANDKGIMIIHLQINFDFLENTDYGGYHLDTFKGLSKFKRVDSFEALVDRSIAMK